jgi:hypothetical protein
MKTDEREREREKSVMWACPTNQPMSAMQISFSGPQENCLFSIWHDEINATPPI